MSPLDAHQAHFNDLTRGRPLQICCVGVLNSSLNALIFLNDSKKSQRQVRYLHWRMVLKNKAW
jgi:hypothetical protein